MTRIHPDFLYVAHSLSSRAWERVQREKVLITPQVEWIHQFPGVYMSLVTKHNVSFEQFYEGNVLLLFSRRLLEQKNYHVNYIDHNGIITRKTVYPWNLNKFLEYEKKYENIIGNEITFHDKIDLKYLCKVIDMSKTKNVHSLLPKSQLENNKSPDLSKLPFLGYVDTRIYTGRKFEFYNNSVSPAWLRAMAQVAGVNHDGTNEQIWKRIAERRDYLHTHRNEQNMKPLLSYLETQRK